MDNSHQQNYFLEDPKTSDDFHCSYAPGRQNLDYHHNATNFPTSNQNIDYSNSGKYFIPPNKTDSKNGCSFDFNTERQNYFENGVSLNDHFFNQYPSNVQHPPQQFQPQINNQNNFLDRCYLDQQQQMSQRQIYYPFYNNNSQAPQKPAPQTMNSNTNASNKYPDTPPDSGSEPYSPPTSNPSMLSNPSHNDTSKVMYPTASNTNAANPISSYNKNNSSSGNNIGCSKEFVMRDNNGKIDMGFEKTKNSSKIDKLDVNCISNDLSKKTTVKSSVYKNNKNDKEPNLNKIAEKTNFIEPNKKSLNEKQKHTEKNNDKAPIDRIPSKNGVNMNNTNETKVPQNPTFVDPNLRSGLGVFSQEQQKQHTLNYNKTDPSIKTVPCHRNNRQQHYPSQEQHRNQQQYNFPLILQQIPKRPSVQPYTKGSFPFYSESSRINEQDYFYAQNGFGSQFAKKRKLSDLTPFTSSNDPLVPPQHFPNNYLPAQYNYPCIKHEPEFGIGFMPEGSEDDSYSCDLAGADASCTESSYRVISWGLHSPQDWCQMFNEKGDEVVLLSYRVDADKGFNYALSDESFVCQKKNHFQITVHISVSSKPHFIKSTQNPGSNLEKIDAFYLHFYGIKAESPNQTIKIEQSQSDRSKKTFHPVKLDLIAGEMNKVTVGRLHYSETTLNNMRKKGKPNPDQRYFQLVVALEAYTSSESHTVAAHVSDKIIVRASNPGQFENDVDVVWNKGKTNDVVYHTGRVGINTDNPDEALTVHGNIRLTGHVISPSDARAKTNIKELDTSEQLENIKKLKLYKYEYIEDFAKIAGLLENKEDAGVLAQEVEGVIPGAVRKGGDVVLFSGNTIEDFLVVNKERIFMENIGAVKELSKVTCKLNERIGEIELMRTKLKTFCKNKFGSVWSNASSVSISFSGSFDSDKKSFSASSSTGSKQNFKKLSSNSDSSLPDNKNKNPTPTTEISQPSSCFSSSLWFSRRTQLMIMLLIVIMTACLVSITTLYIIDRHNANLQTQKLVESLKSLTKTSGTPAYKGSTNSVVLIPPYCVKNPSECPVVCCEKPFNNPSYNTNRNITDKNLHTDVSDDFNYYKNRNETSTKDFYKPQTDIYPQTYDNPAWWKEFKSEINRKKKNKKKSHPKPGKDKSKNLYYNYYIQGPYVYINPSKNHHHKKEPINQDGSQDYRKERVLTMYNNIKDEEMISDLSDYNLLQVLEKNKNSGIRMKRDVAAKENNQVSTLKPSLGNVKSVISPTSSHQETKTDPEMLFINIVQTNTTLDTIFCVSDDCAKRKGFNFTYNVPVSSRYPKAFLTIQFLPRASNTALVMEFCGEKKQESCEQYLEESAYSTKQTGLYTWDLPIGYFSNSQYFFRISHKRQKGLCLLTSKSKEYMTYNFNFYRTCTDAL